MLINFITLHVPKNKLQMSLTRFTLIFLLVNILLNNAANAAFFQAGQPGDINKKDTEGRKQGRWIYFGKDRPQEGYPADGKIEEGDYKDDRKEGKWIKYHNDGETPKLVGEYVNNRPQGPYVKYFANGKVKEQGTFVRNLYQDSLKRFHENGKVEYQAKYNESGKEQGSVKYFYPNGQVEFEYTANDGKPSGKAVRYYENGDVKEIIFYNAEGSVEKSEQKEMVNPAVKVVDPGISKETAPKVSAPKTKGAKFQPNGYNKIYNNNDEIWQDGNFKNGLLWDGKVYEYDRDGILLKVKVYKNGLYHSDGQL
jgi:antitoxin component YwqK of YwqJK toxin-antitoxin module